MTYHSYHTIDTYTLLKSRTKWQQKLRKASNLYPFIHENCCHVAKHMPLEVQHPPQQDNLNGHSTFRLYIYILNSCSPKFMVVMHIFSHQRSHSVKVCERHKNCVEIYSIATFVASTLYINHIPS